jgi:hypothetical protein
MSGEAWAFLAVAVGGLVSIVTTMIIQNQTTRRAFLESQALNTAKTETVGRSAHRAAEAAELAVSQTATVANGTVPKIIRHLEDQGGMLVRLTAQVDQMIGAQGRTVARLDQTADALHQTTGTLMGHLADHARTGEINLRGSTS